MISTGIVRSIDNLGRVVLPKELRNTYSIAAAMRLAASWRAASTASRKRSTSRSEV